jgi:L-lysine exporter family protein LysE/ArgO
MSLVDGLIMGFAFAMPLGSQNVFVINNALNQKLSKSYHTAAAVSIMDVSLGIACFFGIGAALTAFPALRLGATLFGASYVLWVAIGLVRNSIVSKESANQTFKATSFWATMTSAFLLTWINPHALLDGSIILGGQRAGLAENEIPPFVLGMCSASVIWFFGLTTVIGLFRTSFTDSAKRTIEYFCAALMVYISITLFIKSGVFS